MRSGCLQIVQVACRAVIQAATPDRDQALGAIVVSYAIDAPAPRNKQHDEAQRQREQMPAGW